MRRGCGVGLCRLDIVSAEDFYHSTGSTTGGPTPAAPPPPTMESVHAQPCGVISRHAHTRADDTEHKKKGQRQSPSQATSPGSSATAP